MRILYVNTYQGPDLISQRKISRNRALGGSRKMELVSRILQEQGHEVVVLSAGIPAERSGRFYPAFESTITGLCNAEPRVLYAAGLDIKCLNYPVAVFSSIQLLRRETSGGFFDLLMMYNIDEFVWPVSRFYYNLIQKIPLVLQYEDSVAVSSRGINIFRRMLWRSMEHWLHPRLAGIIGVNAAVADRLQNRNTYVLRGTVDKELCRLATDRKSALSGSLPYLALFCGSLSSGKGVEFIPEIAARFKGRVCFAIVGTGPLLDKLSSMSRDCGGDVQVLGYLERPDLNRLLASADIFLNPHEDEHSGGILPFKLIEYLVAGGIVVTTKVGNLDDPIFDYCEVTYPNSGDISAAIERVLENREEMMTQARKAQTWATAQYAEDIVGRKLHNLVSRAVMKDGTVNSPTVSP
jgi:glycosyltransferase involved in cell wall biosynthesis